jgi:hypothetical protein
MPSTVEGGPGSTVGGPGIGALPRQGNTTPAARVAVPIQEAAGHRLHRGRPTPLERARAGRLARRPQALASGRCR